MTKQKTLPMRHSDLFGFIHTKEHSRQKLWFVFRSDLIRDDLQSCIDQINCGHKTSDNMPHDQWA